MAHRRPRPINVKDRLAIITDEQQIHEIDVDCSPEKPQIKVEGKKRPERERRYVNGLSMLPSAQMVPIPLFREIKEDKVSKKQRPFEFPPKYITYDEPTPDEEEHIIDYDMDSEDEKFLTTLNNQSSISSAQHLAALKEQEFEALFDLFEKTHQKMKDGVDETFPKVIAHLFRMIRAEDTEDATCSVCNDGEYTEDNMIIFCDGCNIGVHQGCYGLKMVPPEDFYCDRCKYIRECETSKRTTGKNTKIPQVRCEFCTVKTGAFKPLMYLNHNSKHQPRWAHVSCAMWIPECSFSNTPTLDPILALPVPSRNKHKCCVCNEKTGVSFKCSEKKCEEYFHVMCGRSRDFSMYARPACVKEEKNQTKKRTLNNNNNNNNNIKNTNNSNNNTDYNGNPIEGDHLEFVQYCEIHSLKSEIQRTDSHFGYSKLTDEELAELDAFVTTSRGLTLPAYSTELVYWYWRWRRKHHAGSFLRKFHALTPLTTFFDKHRTTPAECLEKMRTMRQHFETLRILLDLMKKREQIKKELIETKAQSAETEFKRLRQYIGWWQAPRRSPRKSPAKRRKEQEIEDEIERYFREVESEEEEEESHHDIEEDDMVLVPEYFEEELQQERQQLEEQQKQEEENVQLLEELEEESIDMEEQDDIEIVDPEFIEEEVLEQQVEEEHQEEDVQEQPEAQDIPEFSQELPALIEEPQQADEPVTLEQQHSEDIPNEDEEEEQEELPREEEEFSIEFGEDQEIDYNVSSGGEHEAPPPTGSLPVTPTRNTVDSDSDVSGAEESYDSLDLEVARNKNFSSYWEDQERLNKIASIRSGFTRGGTIEEPIVIDDISEAEEIVDEKKVQKKAKRKRVNEKNVKSPEQPRKKRKKRKKLFSIV